MAVTHPYGARPARQTGKPMHPAVGLIGGFGFIVGMALAVHFIFSAVV